jgi:hypothetical protein
MFDKGLGGQALPEPPREICRKTIGVKRCMFVRGTYQLRYFRFKEITDKTPCILIPNIKTIVKNDGLTERKFLEYFKNYPEGELAALHFTDFRYGNRDAKNDV